MALPKLNDVPYYSITIPSTGQETRYRPYLVKEEKVLLIALESSDIKQIAAATTDLIKSCVETDINLDKLTTFDIEYLFINIRSKAVGESIKVNFMCSKCDTENEVTVNLDKIAVPISKEMDRMINLTDDVRVEMQHLSYKESTNNSIISTPETYAEYMFETVLRSMYKIYTEEEQFIVQDESDESVIEFINSLTSEQFSKLREFVDSAPQVSSDVNFTCTECSEFNEYTLRGLNDFFG